MCISAGLRDCIWPVILVGSLAFLELPLQEYKNVPCFILFFSQDFMCLSMRDTEREAETQAEGEAGSLRGARSWDPGVTP